MSNYLTRSIKRLGHSIRSFAAEGILPQGPLDNFWYGPVVMNPLAGVRVDQRSAMRFSAVFSCVRIISESLASLPLHVYRRTDTGKERDTSHPLYRILHDYPNDEMSAMQYRETAQAHVLLWGNHYAERLFDGAGRLKGLYPLDPGGMIVKRNPDGSILYEYHPSGIAPVRKFRRDEIFHLAGIGFNGLTGMSPIEFAKESVGMGLAGEEFGARFFSNGAFSSGVLRHPGKLDDKAYDRLKKSWDEGHSGLVNAWKPAILEEGMEWTPIGMPLKDAQFLELRKFQINEICRIYRVPPHMVGDLERATFSNIEQQAIDFVTNALRPWGVRWEQAIFMQLLSPREQAQYFAEHLFDGLLRGDIKSRYEAYAIGRQWGWLSSDDIRSYENMNPIGDEDGGEKYLSPLNMTTLALAGEVIKGKTGQPADWTDPKVPDNNPAGKVQKAFSMVFASAASRIIAREVNDARRALKKGTGDFRTWMHSYYAHPFPDEESIIAEAVLSFFVAGLNGQSDSAAARTMVYSLSEMFSWHRREASLHELQTVLRGGESILTGREIESRLDQWERERPAQMAEAWMMAAAQGVKTLSGGKHG